MDTKIKNEFQDRGGTSVEAFFGYIPIFLWNFGRCTHRSSRDCSVWRHLNAATAAAAAAAAEETAAVSQQRRAAAAADDVDHNDQNCA
jgi:hypothetical protein